MRPEITCAAIGEGNLLLCCLQELTQREFHINAVFTNTDCVQAFCEEHGLPCHKRNADLVTLLKSYTTDYLFSISNPRILKEDVLKLPVKFTINYHDSPLPAYAGVHATSWAIISGERYHGISWHVVEIGIDTGDILESETVEILDSDSALTLNLKCIEASKQAFCRLADGLMYNTVKPAKQPDTGRTYFGLYAIPPNVGLLKFTNDINTIYNSARALEFGHHENMLGSPKVKTSTGQFCLVTNVEKLDTSTYSRDHNAGKIVDIIDDTLVVATESDPIGVSLAYLHGAQIPEKAFSEYGLVIGDCLDSSFDIDEDDVVAIRKKETYWRRKMLHYEPTMFYRQKMNVVACVIEVSTKVNIKSVKIELPQTNYGTDIDSSTDLQANFVAFLARINCTSSVQIGILTDKKGIPNDCKDLYADIVPCVFNVDNTASVHDVLDKCKADLKLHKDGKTYLHDMFYRYPELRGSKRTPHHNLVISANRQQNLCEKQLQHILQDCNVLLFVGGKNGTQLDVMFHERPSQDISHVVDVLKHFGTFLDAASNCKDNMQLRHVSMITENDKNQFYRMPAQAKYSTGMKESNISELVDSQCKLTPLSIAIKSTNNVMTYSKLASEISLLQIKLDGITTPPPTRGRQKQVIALHMPNSISYVVSLLAVVKKRIPFLPLPIDLPAERLCFMLRDAHVHQIMMTKDVYNNCNLNGMTAHMRVIFEHQIQDEMAVFVEVGQEKNTFDIDANGDSKTIARLDDNNNDYKRDGNDHLYVMYTSGSTGRPKGVKVRESSAINLARAQILGWDIVPGDVIAQFASIGFDATISEIFTSLLSGASLAILGSSERLGSEFVAAMTKLKVSCVTLPPSALNIYSPDDLSTLRKVISAGESCTLNTAVKWTSAGVRFFNAYGPTEGTVCATMYEYIPGDMYELVNRELPIGRAIDGVQVYLFDDFRQPLPADVVGEIYIGGKGLAHGYIGHASQYTAERFVQNPLSKSPELLYRTGDHAYQDREGNLTYIGRTDDQVKIRGHRIDLNEIEQVLIQHTKVEMAVVVVHRCSSTNDLAIAAYIAPTFVYASELREYVAKVMPKYMVPTYIKTVEVQDLPKTVNGKINRKKLEIDESVHEQLDKDGHSHLNDIQLTVARHWCKVFKFEDSFLYSLHRQSSFSELGGNSLQLVLLMRQLEDNMDVSISFTDLGTADTIEEFADVIRRRCDIKTKSEHNESKSRPELRELIYHDSELESSFFPNPERRRSVQVPSTAYIRRSTSRNSPKNILLSGVTGFLGAFLLSEILEQSNSHVCCMVRESTEARGLGRIMDNMRKYGLWKFEYASRIAVVLSDLSQEHLGIAPDIYRSLCNAIDIVFMNAAMMNFNTPYEDHRQANVIGTKEFIRFATTGVKKYLFTTSSLSVFLFPPDKIVNGMKRKVMSESDFFDDPLLIEGGYGQSKWASERLVMQALEFLPGGAIFRPARVSGRSSDGVGPRNDLFASILVGMNKMGSYPDMDFPFDLTPVDFCAKSMVEVTLKTFAAQPCEQHEKIYHLFNTDTIAFKDLFVGMPLKALPLNEWRKELRNIDMDNKELLPLTPFFMSVFWDRARDWPVFNTCNIDNTISDQAKLLLKPTKELVPIYKRFFEL